MNEITTDVKTHAIITHSKAHYFITSTQEKALVKLGMDDRIAIDGNLIKGSSIAEVMTLEKYYETYPGRKPVPEPMNPFPKITVDFRSPNLSQNGLTQMIKGIERAIAEFRAEGKEPLKALKLLEKAKKSYREKYEIS